MLFILTLQLFKNVYGICVYYTKVSNLIMGNVRDYLHRFLHSWKSHVTPALNWWLSCMPKGLIIAKHPQNTVRLGPVCSNGRQEARSTKGKFHRE